MHPLVPNPLALPAADTTLGGEATGFAFAGYVFDMRRDQLTKDGMPVVLAPKPRALLRYFLSNPERVVDKRELITAVWASTVVTDDSLVQLVLELRNALGDREQHIVKTVPRRGYLFDAPVTPLPAPSEAPLDTWPGRRCAILTGAAALVCAIGGLCLWIVQRQPPYSIDEALANRFSMFVVPLVEDDRNGEPSQFGRRIAGDISSQLLRWKTRILTPEQGAKYELGGRVLRRNGGGITIETQMRNLSTGDIYPLIQPSFASEEEATQSDLATRVMRGMWNRRDEIILAEARRPGHQPDPLELVHLGWNDLDLSKTEADLRHADARFEEALRRDPTSFRALLGLSATCFNLFTRFYSAAPRQDFADCDRRIQRVFARAPENPDAMNAAAFTLQVQGRLDEALFLLRKSLKLATRNRVAHWQIATVLIRQGRFDEARPHLEFTRDWAERTLEHGPSDHRLQANRYQLFADAAFLQGNDDDAYRWLQRWATEMPDSGRPYLMLAAIDALKGRHDQAKAEMKRHRELLPYSNVSYVAMMYPSSSPAIAEQCARLLDGMRKAGLPESLS